MVIHKFFHSSNNGELWFLFSEEYEEQPSGLVPDSAPLLPEGPTEAEEGSLTLDKVII